MRSNSPILAVIVGLIVTSMLWASSAMAAELTKYSFEDNANDTAVGDTHDDSLSMSGTVSYVQGLVGKAASFTAGNYFVVTNSSDLNLGTAPWTIEAFFKVPDQPSWSAVCASKWDQGAPSGYFFGLHDSDQKVVLDNDSGIDGTAGDPLDDGKWHHVLISNNGNGGDSAGVKCWVDGTNIQSANGYSEDGPDGYFYVGVSSSSGNWPFPGVVDELIIHDEVKDSNYVAERVELLADASILTRWSFEGNAEDSGPSGTTADDLTITNGTVTFVDGVPGMDGTQAVNFGDDDAYMRFSTFPTPADIRLLAEPWTVELFIKVPAEASTSWQCVLSSDYSHGGYFIGLKHTDEYLTKIGSSSGITAVGPALDDDEWHHIMITNNGDTDDASGYKYWVDGVNTASGYGIDHAETTAEYGNWFTIGCAGWDTVHQFEGTVDEVIYHNEVKDASYVAVRAELRLPPQGTVITIL
ncbi:MAG: hypothetical protein HN341_17725 [Verrucomicrobia bacterium]|jgi:hypothetical protein|nr:hypothetical protein [Verrucomicrobiota bacterium]